MYVCLQILGLGLEVIKIAIPVTLTPGAAAYSAKPSAPALRLHIKNAIVTLQRKVLRHKTLKLVGSSKAESLLHGTHCSTRVDYPTSVKGQVCNLV